MYVSVVPETEHFCFAALSVLEMCIFLADIAEITDIITLHHRYKVAQNKIPHQTMCNISATSGVILKTLEAA